MMRLLAFIVALLAAPSAYAQAPDFVGRLHAESGATLPPQHRLSDRVATRPDGAAIHWYVDRRDLDERQGVILILQGSGCASVTRNLNMAIAAQILRPRDAIIVIDKPGVMRGDNPDNPMETCSDAFWRGHTVSRRAEDASLVLDAIEREGWWNGRLTLFGGSEGGAVAALLAAQREETDAAIILSSALGRPLRESILDALPPPVRAIAPAEFEKFRTDPDPGKRWGGNTQMWWADILDRDLAASLLQSRAKILIVQGDRDQFSPAADARIVRDRFAASGKCNLTYREYADLEHQMRDEAGENRFTAVLQDVEAWLDRNDAAWRRCARA